MTSIAHWASDQGWDYQLKGDEFFLFAPDWVHRRCTGNIYAVTDICRLQWMHDCLQAGYERAIWVDADVLVVAAQQINMGAHRGYAFAHELFIRYEKK